MFGKLFASMYDGSLHGDWKAIVVLQQLVIVANQHGEVDATPEALADRTGLPIDIIEHGLAVLSQPDKRSRSPDQDGRRIVPLDPGRTWGWRLVNYLKYRNTRDDRDRREQNRQAQERARARKKASARRLTNDDIADCQHPSATVSHGQPKQIKEGTTVVGGVKDKEPQKKKKPPTLWAGGKEKERTRAVPLPAGLTILPAHRAKAERLGLDVEFEFEQFQADAGAHRRMYHNWALAFTGWLGRQHQFTGTKPPTPADQLQRELLERDAENERIRHASNGR